MIVPSVTTVERSHRALLRVALGVGIAPTTLTVLIALLDLSGRECGPYSDDLALAMGSDQPGCAGESHIRRGIMHLQRLGYVERNRKRGVRNRVCLTGSGLAIAIELRAQWYDECKRLNKSYVEGRR